MSEGECASDSGDRLRLDRSTKFLTEVFANVKAQTVTIRIHFHALAAYNFREGLEKLFDVLLAYSYSTVIDGYFNETALHMIGYGSGDFDGRSNWREFQRV